MKLGLGT